MVVTLKTIAWLFAVILVTGVAAWAQEPEKRPSEMIRFKKGEHPRI